jgi:N-acetylmuramoyl-L-alanine amidase
MQNRIERLRLAALIAVILAAVVLGRAIRLGRLAEVPGEQDAAHTLATPTLFSVLHLTLPTFTPEPASSIGAPDDSASPTPPLSRIGIIPGHWQFDTGAVCPDGRREVDVTTDVALRLQALLEYRGFEVDLLPEHDPTDPQPPLQGYRGAALVSIHADSCGVPGASGFKVARWEYSSMPDIEDRLVECLNEEYAASTLLPLHEGSITVDMLNYYAFRELALETPAAIIELGFLQADREVLDGRRYEMALGIANGIGCFLAGR